MPVIMPNVEPTIPEGYLFVLAVLRAPTSVCPSGHVIMGWPTKRRDYPEGPLYDYPVTPERVMLRAEQENLDVVRWRIVSYNDIPKDRVYRDALTDDGTKLGHDMPKAREVHRGLIRQYRTLALADLDAAYLMADEKADKAEKARIVTLKQELRDLPAHPAIDAAKTVDELKTVWHEALK
jgi:hypothetical protein